MLYVFVGHFWVKLIIKFALMWFLIAKHSMIWPTTRFFTHMSFIFSIDLYVQKCHRSSPRGFMGNHPNFMRQVMVEPPNWKNIQFCSHMYIFLNPGPCPYQPHMKRGLLNTQTHKHNKNNPPPITHLCATCPSSFMPKPPSCECRSSG